MSLDILDAPLTVLSLRSFQPDGFQVARLTPQDAGAQRCEGICVLVDDDED